MDRFVNLLSGRGRQWLMGFAILWVIAFHFCMYGNLLRIDALNFLFGKGYLGVDIFFFLSSYGLCYSYCKRSTSDYYKQRVKRLFPMYLVFVLVLVICFKDLLTFSPWLSALLQLTGAANFTGMEVEWYIPALIVLYVLFPLIFRGVRALYSRNCIYVILLILLLVLAAPFISKGVFYLFAIRFPIIIIGIAAYLAIQASDEKSLLAVLTASAIIGFCFSGKEMLNGSQTGMLVLPLILYGLAQIGMKLPAGSAVEFCGRHSLEIYLAQNIALNQFYANYDNVGFIEKTAIAIVIIAVGGFVLYYSQTLFYKLFGAVDKKS